MELPAETPREFGEELRRERELRDVGREQLAAAIRISVRQLDALEEGRFEILPAKVFSRGFVRSIALHLGLDADHYASAFAAVWDAWSEVERSRKNSDLLSTGRHVRLSKPRRASSMSMLLVGGGLALAIALVTFGAFFFRGRSERPALRAASRLRVERSTPPATGPASLALPPAIASSTVPLPPATVPPSNSPVAVPTPAATPTAATVAATASMVPTRPAPAATAVPVAVPTRAPTPVPAAASSAIVAAPAGPAPAGAPGGLVLKMAFRDDCWTEVSADGRPVAAELFRKGAARELSAARRFVVTIGNAGAVSLWLNGSPVKVDGGPGKVVKNLVLERPAQGSAPAPR